MQSKSPNSLPRVIYLFTSQARIILVNLNLHFFSPYERKLLKWTGMWYDRKRILSTLIWCYFHYLWYRKWILCDYSKESKPPVKRNKAHKLGSLYSDPYLENFKIILEQTTQHLSFMLERTEINTHPHFIHLHK